MQILIGERLLELRTKKQMTQEELAERLGVTRQSVSKWESNGTFPNMNKLIDICEIFQVSLDYLLRGVGNQLVEDNATEATATETMAGHPKEEIKEKKKQGALYIKLCMILVGSLFIISCWLLGSVLVNYEWNTDNKVQDIVHVDTVYEQYTKAKVSILTDDGINAERVLWLDTDGVRENDWVFCYTDGKKMKMKYGSRTLLIPMCMAIVYVLIIILLWMELRRENGTK